MSSPTTIAPAVTVTVRYFAGAKAAAGVATEMLSLPAGTTVEDLVTAIAAGHGGAGGALARVLAASSFLLDEVAVHDRGQTLRDDAVLDVLPPFAGG